MPKRSSIPRQDLNQAAACIEATGDTPHANAVAAKNPAAVELGRLGGKKGGKARAEALSSKKRSEIASKAAQARWSKKK